MKKVSALFTILTVCFSFVLVCQAQDDAANTNDKKETGTVELSPETEVVVLETDKGTMVVRFFDDKAPGHMKNFKDLAKKGFYDGTKFHRVIKGFMIQGGDPNTKSGDPSTWGTGGPGYKIKAEFNDVKHDKGILSMARSADPNSAGSQFFIMHGRSPHLDNQYTAFGTLVEGLEVLDAIATAPVKASPQGEKSSPTEPVTLKKATVTTWGNYQKSKEDQK